MPRSRVEELRQLRLDLLEVPWDPNGREIVLAEMDRLGLSSDRLYVRLVNAGWEQSYSTLGRWLRGQSEPSATELGLLTEVLLNYPDNWPNWPKASNLSSPQEPYSFWPIPRVGEDIRLPIPA
jgi:hypothetical protein